MNIRRLTFHRELPVSSATNDVASVQTVGAGKRVDSALDIY